MRRLLIPIAAIVLAYVALPPLMQSVFRADLPVAELTVHAAPRPLPDVSFLDEAGRSLTLKHFNRGFVLVNVWATWCPPCREEMASLDRLTRLMADGAIAIVPISIDVSGVPTVRYFYERQGLENLPILVDPSKAIMAALGVVGIPTTLLIDPDGNEVARMVGPAQWDAPETVQRILQLIR